MDKKISGTDTRGGFEAKEIVIWCLSRYEELFNNLADEYVKVLVPEVDFKIVGIDYSDMRILFDHAYVAGVEYLPDMIITPDYCDYLVAYRDWIISLDEYIDTSIFASYGAVGNLSIEGKLIGFPIYSEVAAFYYNCNIFEECEIEIPENYTIDDFLEYATKIKDYYGGSKYIIAYTNELARIFMQSTGQLFYNSNGELDYTNVMELFEFFESLKDNGLILIDDFNNYDILIDSLLREEVCGIIGAPYWIKFISDMVADNGLDQEWDVVPLPKSYPFNHNVSVYDGAALIIDKGDEEKQAILVNFLTQAFTANGDAPFRMVEAGAVVPVTKFVCKQLENVEYPQCFAKNVYAFLAGMLSDIPPIAYGEYTPILSERLEKVTQQIVTGQADVITGYNIFISDIPTIVPTPPQYLIRIEIYKNPYKMKYYRYESFDPTGMVVIGVYSGGARKQINVYDVQPHIFNNVGRVPVKITYNGYKSLSTTLIVIVTERKLTGISVGFVRRVFLQGDTLSNDDFEVIAHYDDRTDEYIQDFNILDRSLEEVGKKTVYFTYSEGGITQSCQKVIEVNRRLIALRIEQDPKKLMYYDGDRFDTTGMKVAAVYSNETSKILSNGYLYITPEIVEFANNDNTTYINIVYSENGVSANDKLTVYRKTGVELDDCNITQDFGVSGSGFVNEKSGHLYYGFKDFICSDSDFPIAISRTYKKNSGSFGVGADWRLNLQQELIFSDGHWNYIDKIGKEHTFSGGYSAKDGRSDIRNEELGFDLFQTEDGRILLVDRSNNALVFTNINEVYRLSAVHKYPSTPDNPIAPYSMEIVYDLSSGCISNVSAGRVIDGKRRSVQFVYTDSLLTQLVYNFASSTVVAEYEYNGNDLVAVKKSNGNVIAPYSAITEFEKTNNSFTVLDRNSKDSAGNYKSLIYTIGAEDRVSAISIGYGENDREITTLQYTGKIDPVEGDNPVTNIVASCYSEYNGVLSVTSFNSQCAAATYSYERGADGTYAKPKKVYSASSRGFDYKALADSYSDTLDVLHDDFEDNSACEWEGGTLTTEKCICGTASLSGKYLKKDYTFKTSASGGETLYLSLWVLANEDVSVFAIISGSQGSGSFSHHLDSGLNGKWQFTAFNLGRVANNEKIKIRINGYKGVCIDDIRLTKAPYEMPTDIEQPKYNAFGNIEKEYAYSPVDGKVACTTYKYNTAHQVTEKAVTVNGKTHSKSVYEYQNGLLVSDKEYGTGKRYFEEAYAYTDNVQTKTWSVNNVKTEYSEGLDWIQSVTGVLEFNSPAIAVKNTYYSNSNSVKQVSSSEYINTLTYNTYGALLSAQYGNAQSSADRTEIKFEYDTFGNMRKATIGTVSLVLLEYDYKHLNKITYANGDSIEYTYDGKNRITAITESGGYSATVAYADNPEAVTVTDTNGLQYQSRTINTGGKTSEYSARFDGDSAILKVVGLAMNGSGNISTTEIYTDDGETPFERLKTVVDRNGQLTELKRENNGASSTYAYDELYRLKSKSTTLASVKFKSEYTYGGSNDNREFNRIRAEKFSVGNTVKDEYSYLYYDNGNLSMVNLNGEWIFSCIYDDYGRIKQERNVTFGEKYVYEYDVNGNIISKKTFRISDSTLIKTYVYDYANITDGCGQNAAWRDQLKSYNGQAIHYDKYGNPTVYLGKSLTWTGRKLVKIDSTAMEYDYSGMRVKKGSKRYYWQGDNLRMEQDTVRTIYYYYDESGICGMNCNGTDYYYQKNMLGDICAIYNKSGEMICRYVYDAWGNHKLYDKNGNEINDDGNSIGSINPFRYRGYYWDKEFGLYYLKSRYYDPQVGRFISPDSIDYLDPASICGMNLYAYCGDNPIMYHIPALGGFVSTDGAKYPVSNNIGDMNLYASRSNSTVGKKGNFLFANYFLQEEITADVWGVDNFFWGRFKYSVSSVVWRSSEETGLFYAYNSTINYNMVSYHAGINLYDWWGIDFGVSSGGGDASISIGGNITPWFHMRLSVGLSGITFSVGVKYNGKSHDFSIGTGSGSFLVFAGVIATIVSGGVAAIWAGSLFGQIFNF